MCRTVDDAGEYVAWRIVAGDFVTTDSGTGLVHIAPAFGETDHDVLIEQAEAVNVSCRVPDTGPELICASLPTANSPPKAPNTAVVVGSKIAIKTSFAT